MSKIREVIVTNCEKKFLNNCLKDWTRLDGRSFDEFRPFHVEFGKDWGSCCVTLGRTRVLAQTSCEIQQPKSSRPSEGILNINLELNPLAAAHFEPGRQTDLTVMLNRLLEKCFKDSKAVDLESLCIKTNEKVWALRVDVNVLNHEGNILDCASVAMLTALAHFRRPDVTCDGEEFIVHSYQQRDPIPTVIHHYPVCVTYSIFNGGEFILADPSLIEEGAADATLIIGLNGFKELCGLHLGGKVELLPNVILSVVSRATNRASRVIDQIKESIQTDNEARQTKVCIGFHNDTKANVKISEPSIQNWREITVSKSKEKNKSKKGISKNPQIQVFGKGSAAFVPQELQVKENSWESNHSDDDLIIEADREPIKIDGTDSEEDDIIILDNTLKPEK